MSGGRPPLIVAHTFQAWLPVTMTWAYNQVRYAPGVRGVVLAERLQAPEAFPWHPVVAPGVVDRLQTRLVERTGRSRVPRAWRAAAGRFRPALLHSHFGYRGWRDLALARRFALPHVVTFYGHDVAMFPRTWPEWRRRYEELFAAADLFLCEGPFMARTLVEQGCPEHKVGVQRLGVELDRLAFGVRAPSADGVVRVLVAGAFREKKGIPDALTAVAGVRRDGVDVRVTVVGDAGPGPGEQAEKRRILAVLDRERLHGAVRLLGFRPYDRLLAEMRTHHLFLSPSRHASDGDSEGGAPVTIMEAAATGMPVVSTRHCDIPQVVEDGVSGVLVPEGDAPALTKALGELAAAPRRWAPMGEAARRLMEERFDVRRCAEELVQRYRRVAMGA